jgi:hypothetical protein
VRKELFDKSQLFTLLGDGKETRDEARDAVAVIKERIRFKGSICCALYIRPGRCDARDKKENDSGSGCELRAAALHLDKS